MSIILVRKLNHRNIELHQNTKGECVGVRTRDGEYIYYPWLGFITADKAKGTQNARPVKLKVQRIGTAGVLNNRATQWQEVPDDKHIQGCLTQQGVYAVVDVNVRVV